MTALVLLGVQLAVSGLFLVAASGKILNSADFTTAISASGIRTPFVRPIAFGIILLEALVSVTVLLGDRHIVAVAFIVSAAFLLATTAWIAWVRARGLRLRCGCFGSGQAEIGKRTILRNVALLAVVCGGLSLSLAGVSILTPPPSVNLLALIVSSELIGLLVIAFAHARSALVLRQADLHSGLEFEDL
jgi:hypothetical protein